MSEQNEIKLLTLEDMKVISFHGFGKSPEDEAWRKLQQWIEDNHHQDWIENQRFFGFNNPNPSPGSENYGYEQWITIPAGYEAKEGETVKEFSGGLYAVAGFRNQSLEAFGSTWQSLNEWRVDSDYLYDESRQWLEELLSKENVLTPAEKGSFDCYMPIVKMKA